MFLNRVNHQTHSKPYKTSNPTPKDATGRPTHTVNQLDTDKTSDSLDKFDTNWKHIKLDTLYITNIALNTDKC